MEQRSQGQDRSELIGGPLGVVTWLDRGRAMAELVGELDVYTSRQLAEALVDVQKSARRPVLVLVLEELTFADSSGLGVMVGALKRARADGGAVALVGTPSYFAKVLRITGIDKVLPTFDSFEDAWAWLDETAP